MSDSKANPDGNKGVRCNDWLDDLKSMLSSYKRHHARLWSLRFRKVGIQFRYLGISIRYRFRMVLLHLKHVPIKIKRLRLLLAQCRINYCLIRLYFLDKSRCLSVLRLLAEDGKKFCDLRRSGADCDGVHNGVMLSPNR